VPTASMRCIHLRKRGAIAAQVSGNVYDDGGVSRRQLRSAVGYVAKRVSFGRVTDIDVVGESIHLLGWIGLPKDR
jgi:hypothetical protein